MSSFYATDPFDPMAPVVLDEWEGLRPGMTVLYGGPMPLPGPHVIVELLDFVDYVLAVLDDGVYEVQADNLTPAP